VRSVGQLSEITDVAAADHVCWVHDDPLGFDAAARNFALGGLDRGERLLAVGERVIDSLRAGSVPLADLDRLVAEGAIETLTVAEAYAAAATFDPERQFEFYDTATRRALDDGHTGLRVLADVSPFAEDPARRAGLIRCEHVADDYVAHGPGMSAMCVYRADLDADTLADAAAAHPLVHSPAAALPAFRVFFDGGRLVIAGSVDTFGVDRLARQLADSPVPAVSVTLDLTRLEFIDLAGCRGIATWAQGLAARSISLTVVGGSRLVQHMWRLLELDAIAGVAFAEATA
jgi:hypothetical protein